ncbi:starch-binding protein [Paenibacillus sp. A14]|uniref:starch-binding protein n=1 Tax=Paenibacillus sp. A14 TaxID=3119820 RepID=UPI002FE1FAE4
MRRKKRPGGARIWSIVLFVAMLLQTIGFTPEARADADVRQLGGSDAQLTAAADYGLPERTKDGLIFHAWNWSFDNITRNLPELAQAGFKAVQTSPIQGSKEGLTEGNKWWILYQPVNFKIGNSQLGSRDDFRRLCQEAEKYGISIIVDVIANHTGNAGGGNQQYHSAHNVDPEIKNNRYFWHEARGVENWNDRWQVTQWGISLPDLNTSNQELQNIIISFLNDAISLGADGFRFDAAKHIELPNDPAGSNFWPRVLGSLNNKDRLFNYGEVLQGGADNFAGYANYLSLAAPNYGNSIRSAVGYHGGIHVEAAKSFNANNVSPSKLVTWVESHDTYANDNGESTGMNDWQIKMGWAIIASRAETTSLFFNRPAGGGKFAHRLGDAGNTLWKDPDIAAVNKFHNAMVGQDEYLRTQGNQIMLVERGTKGMTIVNLGGNAQINSPTRLADGVYQDSASGGGSFTVSNGRITGHLDGGRIAVLYNTAQQTPTVSVDPADGAFFTDSVNVRMNYSNAHSATYTLNGDPATPFRSGDSVSIGAGAPIGSTFVLKIVAANSSGQTEKIFKYSKEDPSTGEEMKVYFYKPADWGAPNIYYYDETLTPKKENAAWPGVPMQSEGNGWYSHTISGWSQANVLFNSGGKQMPGSGQQGYLISGTSWIKDGIVTEEEPVAGKVPVTFVIKNANVFQGQSVYLTGNIPELGDWNPVHAVESAQNPNSQDWTLTINLSEGENIEFKAIKKFENQVVWEGGQNHRYTVFRDNPVVEFHFYN